jgi:hypothetical protein
MTQMHPSRRLLLLVHALLSALVLVAPTLAAQDALHEYRPEIIVTLPRWRGLGVTVIDEQHVASGDLAPTERQQGMGVVSPAFAHGSFGVELRQVTMASGMVEHRWQPQANLIAELGAGLELRNRTRVELRDIAGQWSRRYQNRAAVHYPLRAAGRTLSPYVYYDLSYDTRFAVLNRREYAAGMRIPLGYGVNVDSFLMRQTDTRRAVDALVAIGMILRVAL